ncbi:Trehalase [Portunus trituberculatus]|uniref:Trehalase n=1 Tax=Portunus trituberculatus TaxID=210409 RepID=A0A5B7IAM2_PORTR|nr:Trehalase [Portunus trituberculatus]
MVWTRQIVYSTMKDTNVTSIVPVDLNSLLCVNARTLSYFYNRLGMHTKEREYARIAKEKNDTMSKIFWDQIDGVWYDYDLNAKSRRRLVTPAINLDILFKFWNCN